MPIQIYITHKDWVDDLMRCPSQCYKYIEYKGRHFVIYLRWRYDDPWEATIIESRPDGKFEMFDIFDEGYEWNELPVDDFTHDELAKLKEQVEIKVEEFLKTNI
jgi:hypothetical protein